MNPHYDPDKRQYRHSRSEDDIEMRVGVGSWWARFKGSNIQLLIVVIAVSVCLNVWLSLDHDKDTKDLLRQIIINQGTIIRASEENTYVLSLSQADREKLNIAMPNSLREKLMGKR